ncbi:hypothetical protein JHK84_056016 [Glycine max]|nr:hypothetical protein JHK84_056016 [Glycine max]
MSNGLLAINVAAAHTLDKNMVEANFASNRASKTPLHLLHFRPSLCSGMCIDYFFCTLRYLLECISDAKPLRNSSSTLVDTVIEDTHIINGKPVEIKQTIPREAAGWNSKDFRTKKIFVGGIPSTVTEEGQDEYENDGFIMDKDEEEDEKEDRAESDDEPQKKKKRKKKEEYVLDEDDYELLEDNNINIHRRKESKKFKQLKKGRRDTEEEPFGLSDEEEFVGSGKVGRTIEEKLKCSLFGDDEVMPSVSD